MSSLKKVSLTRRYSAFVFLGALAGFGLGVGCSGGARNVCQERNVRCESPLACDPDDGKCKCGGRGGVECQEGFVCSATDEKTCQSTKCAGIDCSKKPGTSCDGVTGECKCGGTGGLICKDTEVCNPSARKCQPKLSCNEVACPKNQTCEPVSGQCLCGATACAEGQSCSVGADSAKTCVNDLCATSNCLGGNSCDPADGLCKCNGVACLAGEACQCPMGTDGGCADTAKVCRPSHACQGVSCPANSNTLCDPVDGQCKCGGPGGPACASNQICALGPPLQCQGGQQCVNPDGGPKVCGGGTSCDPEDGKCKCGGRGGKVCNVGVDGGTEPADVCVTSSNQQACRRPCDPRSPDCPNGTYCFFDVLAGTPVAYCAPPSDQRGEAQDCLNATACFEVSDGGTQQPRAMHCAGLAMGQRGFCYAYCDVAAGMQGCIQFPKPQLCVQIPMAPAGYGYCQPQS